MALQDGLNYDEPWGKMMPVRHALGGLLCEQGHFSEGESVFRVDLKRHPKNPWGLVGLIACLKGQLSTNHGCCRKSTNNDGMEGDELKQEIAELERLLMTQRDSRWADFKIVAPCACCTKGSNELPVNI